MPASPETRERSGSGRGRDDDVGGGCLLATRLRVRVYVHWFEGREAANSDKRPGKGRRVLREVSGATFGALAQMLMSLLFGEPGPGRSGARV